MSYPKLRSVAGVYDEYAMRREVLAFTMALRAKRSDLMAELPDGQIAWQDLAGWCQLTAQDIPKMLVQLHEMEGISESDSVMRFLAEKGCSIQFKVPPGDFDHVPLQQRQQHVRTHLVWQAVKPRRLQ